MVSDFWGAVLYPNHNLIQQRRNNQQVTEFTEVDEVAEKFVQANGYKPTVPGIGFMKC